MVSTAVLLVLLAVYAVLKVVERVVRALELDVWDTLVYLGLAEHDAPPAPARAHRRPRTVGA